VVEQTHQYSHLSDFLKHISELYKMPVCRQIASLHRIVGIMFVLGVILLSPLMANSHEVRPTIVDFKAAPNGDYRLTISLNLESWLARIGPDHSNTSQSPNAAQYNRLREMQSGELLKLFESSLNEFLPAIELRFDGKSRSPQFLDAKIPAVGDIDLTRDSVLHFSGKIPPGATSVVWQYSGGDSVFRVYNIENAAGTEGRVALYIRAGASSDPIAITTPVSRSAFSSFLEYISIGFDHIIPKGLDHILFVAGLFLLSTKLSPLLWQVTAFTVAHTVTLGLGMAGIISIPSNIVEPLIAASIVYVAVENIFIARLSPWRPVIVFFFGLLHGLGFAGVLKEIGLGSRNFLAGLVGFNVGVELGQLTVIFACFSLVGIWFGNKTWYRQRVTMPCSAVIALIGLWWFYQRVFLT
jgi:hypothetical protein